MDLGLRDRVAVVGASSKGLGKAVATSLAREGARVVICARGEGALRAAEAELGAVAGGDDRVLAMALDLTEGDAPARLVEAAVERFGALHIAVPNNGGPPPGSALGTDDAAYLAAFEANCMASIRLAREAVPHLRASRWGRICFVTSIGVKQPIAVLAASSAARAAVTSFAKTLAAEVAADGITVNCVMPGLHATDRMIELGGGDPSGVPLARLGRPEDFGEVVAFLCSEPAGYVTGASLGVDGGVWPGLL